MANTWHGAAPPSMGLDFSAETEEAGNSGSAYRVIRAASRLEYSSPVPGGTRLTLPVEAVVGGKRNGLSFLERIERLNGIPLARPALIEGRYAYHRNGSSGQLVLSPGFDAAKPQNLREILGRVLSPAFEKRCLTCHGEPDTLGAGRVGGVRCESCHGPAHAHVASVTTASPVHKLIIPAKLTRLNSMAVCAQCHTGLADRSDPIPEDLLVSNQVPALSNSECFIQSEANITCIDCHDPHQDSSRLRQTSVTTCLRCHSVSALRHASVCPMNKTGGCLGCHMPVVQRNGFHLTDHWIRVHPEQANAGSEHNDALRSQVLPRHEFLRIIVLDNHDKAAAARQRLANGEAFAKVAHEMSIDPTASGGGYIGDTKLSEMDAKLETAASHLQYGATSGIVDLNGRSVILYRMPRDFKWQAEQLFQQASTLKSHGDLKGAVEKDQEALQIYPYFLRALVLMGTSLGEAGNAQRASEVLRFAVQTYPSDPSAQFDLALTLAQQPAEQIQALRRAIDLDPDMTAAYESLGAALYSAGQPDQAIDTFRKGLEVDPLSAILNYDLGLALTKNGDATGGKQALALAKAIDPGIGH